METGSIRKSDLEGKYVFWDIDGTLAPYRFNDHVSDPDGTNNGMSLKEISEHTKLSKTATVEKALEEYINKYNKTGKI